MEDNILKDMYQIFKTDSYFNLVKELDSLSKFYNKPYSWDSDIVIYKVRLFSWLHNSILQDFVNTFENLKLTTPNRDIPELNNLYSEIRTKILGLISTIPNGNIARTKYLSQFENYYNSFSQQFDRVDSKEKKIKIEVIIIDSDGYPDVIHKEVTLTEAYEFWKNGNGIHKITYDEIVLRTICSYFNADRKDILLNKVYKTINISQFGKNIDLSKVFEDLCRLKFIPFYYQQAFISLLSGESYFEPIKWEKGLAELNKFIKALYSIQFVENRNKIEWKNVCSIFLVDGEIPDSDQVKGASSAKMESVQELKPFLSIIKSAISIK